MRRIIPIIEMKIGSTYETDVLVLELNQKFTRKSIPYVEVKICNEGESIIAKYFDTRIENLNNRGIVQNNIIRAILNVNEYNGAKSYIVSDAWREYDSVDTDYYNRFVPRVNFNLEAAFHELECLIFRYSSPQNGIFSPISALTIEVLDYYKNEFIHSAGGKSIHHARIGGLLQHSLHVTQLVERLLICFPFIDRELVICGSALHDIGKLRAFNTMPNALVKYNEENRLLGHPMLGIEMVKEVAEKSEYPYDYERMLLLEHIIGTHHVKSNIEAITKAAIPEVHLVGMADSLDATIDTFNSAYNVMMPGEISSKEYELGNTSIYLPKNINSSIRSVA